MRNLLFTARYLMLGFSVCLTGCVLVGVDYQDPKLSTPDAWSASVRKEFRSGRTALQTWWKGFNDPTLNQLIMRARAANPDLRVALERVEQARANRGIAKSQLFPMVNAEGDFVRRRTSESLLVPAGRNPNNLYAAGFDAGWEMDVFGGLRRRIESADASLQASEEDYRDVLITLYAEVAINYTEYRTLQERIRLAEAGIKSQEDSLKLTRDRLEAGLVPKIDVTQAETNLAVSKSLVPQLRSQKTLAANRLATLLGGYPGSVNGLLKRSRPIPRPSGGLASGVPADLLRSRPDVRRGERLLASQTALIGVAEADLYPRFSLFGTLSLQSATSSTFFDSDSLGYSFGPNVSWRIFSAGQIRNNIRFEESATRAALANYENTVLRAVEDVEGAMVSIANEKDRAGILADGTKSAQETVTLVKDNYENGLVNFQNVLDAERTLFSTQDDAAVSVGQVARNYISLYKALGGGARVDLPVPTPEEGFGPGWLSLRDKKAASDNSSKSSSKDVPKN